MKDPPSVLLLINFNLYISLVVEKTFFVNSFSDLLKMKMLQLESIVDNSDDCF